MIHKKTLNNDLRREKNNNVQTEHEMGPKQKTDKPISKLAASTNAQCARNSSKVIFMKLFFSYLLAFTGFFGYLINLNLLNKK